MRLDVEEDPAETDRIPMPVRGSTGREPIEYRPGSLVQVSD